LLSKLRPVEPQSHFHFALGSAGHPRVLGVIEQAIRTKRRARLEYRAVSRRGSSSVVHVEPHSLRVAGGQGYFRGWCVERNAERTYKLARVAGIALTDEPATHAPKLTGAQVFAGAVKAWSGEPTVIRVAIEPAVAWLADEYPLSRDQRVLKRPDGGALVEAKVAGIVETAKWVLSWGGFAEALEPVELRALVRRELAKALAKYGAPGPAKTKGRPEVRPRTGRLTQGGTVES
jgi:predicted DNA-binding transcriptional regulator YafY